MGQDERGADDDTDLAGAGGDVLEGAPAAGEQGESALAQAAQGTEQRIAGAGIDVQLAPAGGLPDRDMDADARAVVSGVGQGGEPGRGGLVQGGQGVDPGGGEI